MTETPMYLPTHKNSPSCIRGVAKRPNKVFYRNSFNPLLSLTKENLMLLLEWQKNEREDASRTSSS